jgi:aromatase
VIRIWATANGEAKTWTSRREHDPSMLSVSFRQERSQPPVGGMGGRWVIQPITASRCHVRLLHDFVAATDDPADLEWINQAVDRNSNSELRALKAAAESVDSGRYATFEDAVTVDGSALDVFSFLNDAQLWEQRLPHVARVVLDERTRGLQILEMDTMTRDRSVHTTRSVRVCSPPQLGSVPGSIVYKQVVLPDLLTLHTGRWLIEERGGGGVLVTSRHTVGIDAARVAELLGPGADLPAAHTAVRAALGGNSVATLRAAKEYAERARAVAS